MQTRPRLLAMCRAAARRLALLPALLLALPVPAMAHPHVWIEIATTIVYENGAFTGVRQTWIFDEFYTSQALDGLPAAKDGRYGRAELAELAKANMDGLKEYAYFTGAKLAGVPLAFKEPADAYLEHVPVATLPGVQTSSPSTATAQAEASKPATAASPPAAPEGGFWSRVWSALLGRPAPSKAAAAAKDDGPKVLVLTFTLPLAQPVMADARDFEVTIADPSLFIWFEPVKVNPVTLSPEAPAGCIARFKDADAAKAAEDKRLGDAFSTAMGQAGSVGSGMRPITAHCRA